MARFAQRSAHSTVKDLFDHKSSDVINLNASEPMEISLAVFLELAHEQDQKRLQATQAIQDDVKIVYIPVRGVGDRKLSIVIINDTHNLHDTSW
eukprot:gnl/MRDRNA2_/MRDRNA2_302068_c0_seq1.p2 gnl/MRDRNA2_/MRDRNA2_302068_c0~~gnl/MRDRNA2_/MRDRNA2_302068_c0_seq1.p2  ORF type:complete len:104 (+),score=20.41 gnl/MRDRNA2_/MRDRNA2_302068_c0_seq1:31-312(+)